MDVPVNQDGRQRPDSERYDAALRELYGLYLRFTAHFAPVGDRDHPVGSLDEFAAWWVGLDPRTRELCERDLRKGYDAVLREAREQVAAAVEKDKRATG